MEEALSGEKNLYGILTFMNNRYIIDGDETLNKQCYIFFLNLFTTTTVPANVDLIVHTGILVFISDPYPEYTHIVFINNVCTYICTI